MKNDIRVIVSDGPTVYDSENFVPYKYTNVGIKWNADFPADISEATENEFINNILLKIKDEFLKFAKKLPNEEQGIEDDKFANFTNEYGVVSLTDAFFEYLKNNETKIEAIRVSLDDYHTDYKEKKLKTLKTPAMVFTADDISLNEIFSNLVKELYYECGDKVIDIYSIILTPKIYKIVNNIPIEYRGLLVRVKK